MSTAKSSETKRKDKPRKRADKLDVIEVLTRQRWLLAFLAMLGAVIGVAYAINAQVWYESRSEILIAEKSAGLKDDSTGQAMLDDATLANHMELIASRMIVGDAMKTHDLLELPSILSRLSDDQDSVDYVIEKLTLAKGGSGSARNANSLYVTFEHTDPEDTQRVLAAVMQRYEKFIVERVEQVMGLANNTVQRAKQEVEEELTEAEQEHLTARREAPLFFQGEGSSNVYQDRYRRLNDELLDLDIRESELRTRLKRVQATLGELKETEGDPDQLDRLAVIDGESLERLGVFAGLQSNSSNTAEFRAAMPVKMEEARTQITGLLRLNSERERLNAIFGPGHPRVIEIESQIDLVKKFLQENEMVAAASDATMDTELTTEGLLKAYVGFIHHDIATLTERRKELEYMVSDAESKAKELLAFEMKDLALVKKVGRQQQLYDTVIEQLRDLDTASGLSGFLYEFLEIPRLGEQVWPSMPLCGFGGFFLGLSMGIVLAFGAEFRDRRFRSAEELDNAIGMPNLGRVGKLNSIEMGVRGLIAAETSPNAEAFRLGRTVLLPKIRSGKLHTIGFTSPMQSDGKSTVTSNFAVCFGQLGLKTIVVDADLRRPSIDRYFSVAKTGGLCDVLEGSLELSDVIKETDASGVSVITAGSSTEQPAELLQTRVLDDTLEELKKSYDVVLVDLPPALAVSDPVVVMPRLDGGVLVVRVARARKDEVLNTIRRVESSGGEFVGCMLNAVGADGSFDGVGGYFGYYESDYTRGEKKNGRAVSERPNKKSSGERA